MNKVILCGNLTRDIELKTTQSGKTVASFSIATNESFVSNGEKKTVATFHNIVVWGARAEAVAQYSHKGDKLLIEGKIANRSYLDKSGVKKYVSEIIVSNFEFLTPKPTQAQNQGMPAQPVNTSQSTLTQQGYQTYQASATAPVQQEQQPIGEPSDEEIRIEDIPF